MHVASLVLSLACVASLGAQTAPCDSLNDSNSNISTAVTLRSFTGPNTTAWRYLPTNATVARGLRIFTNNGFGAGFMSLEIWSDNPVTAEPAQRLGGGTWRFESEQIAKWQGVTFDAPVVMKPQTAYWFVWHEPGFTTVPIEPGGQGMSKAMRLSGTTWVATTSNALKWRLYCSPIDTAGTQVHGPSCASSSGGFGALFNNEPPSVGNALFRLEASGLPSGAAAVWIIGANPSFQSIPLPVTAQCSLNTDIAILLAGVTGSGNVQSSAAAGHCFLPLAIPNSGSLRGVYFGTQVAVIDKGATTLLPMVFTNGLRSTLQ